MGVGPGEVALIKGDVNGLVAFVTPVTSCKLLAS